MPDRIDFETLYFQRFSDLQGNTCELQIGKRNRQRSAILHPASTEVIADAERADNQELRDELCYGLNQTERRTWLKIINGQSLLDIAADEGVQRSAIYSRIRGSRKSKGMIHKNFYVARWWQLRQRGELEQ